MSTFAPSLNSGSFWATAASEAPDETPMRIPSSRAARRAYSAASLGSTWITPSMRSRRITPGMKPAPMPWMVCGEWVPPESTGERVGSTA